ncbi:MAG: AAA family ATPase, partial [Magnetococcales bacterium]|nr:AAA family ATPase [Magnetococcales bacterium]
LELLPDLDIDSSKVGVRLEYSPKNAEELKSNFVKAAKLAQNSVQEQIDKNGNPKQTGTETHHPWPKSFQEYITKKLHDEYSLHYYVLDQSKFDKDCAEIYETYTPPPLASGTGKSCENIINSLIRVDVLNAQRNLSDHEGSARSENLSKRLSRFYERNLKKNEENYQARAALAEAENQLNNHLKEVFRPTLANLNTIGYPGFADPHLMVKSALNAESILNKGAEVHYQLRDPGESGDSTSSLTLPDKYNGLGFKNLIYMVVEVLDFQAKWMDKEEKEEDAATALLHLVIIEEPEAHLHAQLQQVFIKQIWGILQKYTDNEAGDKFFSNQLVVTTHSSHILYESGFTPIRYFRRASGHSTETLNLSKFKPSLSDDYDENSSLQFLQQYMKLTHCDLFFADAAILVEGNVERLLLPLMIDKEAKKLHSSYLSILEVGGAFAHIFRELIEFLGMTALVITDLDSFLPTEPKSNGDDNSEDKKKGDAKKTKRICMPSCKNAVTSNQTLIKWLPKKTIIQELLLADDDEKIQLPSKDSPAHIRVAYQVKQSITWEGETKELAGRTLEEAFALENLDYCQKLKNKKLRLKVITKEDNFSLDKVVEKIHDKVSSKSFKKTDFALGLMMENPDLWNTPKYIAEGLQWLNNQLQPADSEETNTEIDP